MDIFIVGLRISPDNISTTGIDYEEESSYFDDAKKLSFYFSLIILVYLINWSFFLKLNKI